MTKTSAKLDSFSFEEVNKLKASVLSERVLSHPAQYPLTISAYAKQYMEARQKGRDNAQFILTNRSAMREYQSAYRAQRAAGGASRVRAARAALAARYGSCAFLVELSNAKHRITSVRHEKFSAELQLRRYLQLFLYPDAATVHELFAGKLFGSKQGSEQPDEVLTAVLYLDMRFTIEVLAFRLKMDQNKS